MVADTPVLQITGYQNSGKTTVAEELIAYAACHNLKIGSIKHHGHGGVPYGSIDSKDSGRHLKAGAAIASAEGEGLLQLINQDNRWDLEQLVHLYSGLSLDGILVEGYKKENFPKIVMIRQESDRKLVNELTNIAAVISDHSGIPAKEPSYQLFRSTEKERYCQWFIDFLRGRA
ncbi:molybdopterin-guanine dinucleotide biosynthesis protein B [Jeotgalibacillus sp. S-D1]|uniref:molybdopterin-guanine dinucleotide biosynthesis protein B n=1 Tax=Jeotgalibacillus sp. S-D1 TaxID=2552189 RepID=UPI00140560CA|nr:molybdopterin-guanine dinucleotide biosynthesis protein B [Jeotgalibacillus sp. S-D1]